VIAWHEAFGSAFESAWALTQKIAWLNRANSSELFKAVGFEHALQPPKEGVRTFVLGDWLKERCKSGDIDADTPIRDLADFPRALYAHTGASLLGQLAPHLMSNRLRVCPLCIRKGYHSIVHQIAGLVGCPLHKVPLTSTCPACGFSLGDFGLRRYVSPFSCVRCGVPLLEGDELFYFSEAWREAEEHTIGTLVTYLRSLAKIRIDWPSEHHMPFFRMVGEGPICPLTNVEANLWALHQISPLPVERTLLCAEPAGLAVIPRSAPVALAEREHRYDREQKAELLKCIDQAVTAAQEKVACISRRHHGCIRAADYLLSMHRICRDAWLCHDPQLCPIAQGRYLWLARVHRHVTEMRECRDTSWIERYRADTLPRLPMALMSSFFACVTGIVLMLDSIERKDRAMRDYLDGWRYAEDHAWLPDWTETTPEYSSIDVAYGVTLYDPELVEVASCNEVRRSNVPCAML